ncbi:hypothetical protein NDA11_006012 [Ustilago hordei]|nr:hypothetical protein NDA10_002440 [Ustilago hordei]KAJ1574847.1 hypothetical protein NDA12_006821 [Ustilago hordei]KAJ1576745.1 hypothetical protein NDA11_006012 [Ustilago hordei]UTT88819.1 hypothetical protein NDA17_001690 [Ustilago hordei]
MRAIHPQEERKAETTKQQHNVDGKWGHGPKCSGSRRVTGSYERGTGRDLVDTSREHGCSAVSMETMDSYGLTCKGALSHMRGRPGTATRRTKLKEQAQPRRGPSSRSMQMVTTQGLKRQESKELRHQVMRRRSSVEGVDTTQEAQGCQTSSRIARRRSSVEGVDTAQEAQGCQASRRGP